MNAFWKPWTLTVALAVLAGGFFLSISGACSNFGNWFDGVVGGYLLGTWFVSWTYEERALKS